MLRRRIAALAIAHGVPAAASAQGASPLVRQRTLYEDIQMSAPFSSPAQEPSRCARCQPADSPRRDIPLKWVGAYLDAHPGALTTVDALVAAGAPLADAGASLVAFIGEQRLAVPDDAEARARLERLALLTLAYARFGDEGVYSVIAVTNPHVSEAVAAFGQATAVLGAAP